MGATPRPGTVPVPTGTIKVSLVVHNRAFDMNKIIVPAKVRVIIDFTNEDVGIQHNFSLYTDESATTNIFMGEIIMGRGNAVYEFTAPDKAGTYFFQCDVHPDTNGAFIVR